MEPGEIRDLLAVMRESGATTVKVSANGLTLEATFPAAEQLSSAGGQFVDQGGNPIDLDEGMPPLAQDPIASKNFPPPAAD